jgi:hypothetical protein
MDGTSEQCVECLEPVSVAVPAQNGTTLCPQCAAQFYHPCARCGGLIPQDEAILRDGTPWCQSCLAAPAAAAATAALSDAEVSALVIDFVRLHAEAKQLNDRLEAVKEQLKRHAASQPRVANAVVLGTEPFAVLFTRKTTFSPVKGPLDAFLASDDAATAAAERTEVATVTPVVPQRTRQTATTPTVHPAARPQP